jgi:hypothetical protein
MLSIFPHPIISFSPQKLFQTNQALSSQAKRHQFRISLSLSIRIIHPTSSQFLLSAAHFPYLFISWQSILSAFALFTIFLHHKRQYFFSWSSLTQFIANYFAISPFHPKKFFQPHLGL